MLDENIELEENNSEEPKQETQEKESEVATNSDKGVAQWYIANTYSGREKIVKDYLLTRRVSEGLQNEILQVVVPTKIVKVLDKKTQKPLLKKDGTPREKEVTLYPGYIYVEAIMTDLAWYVIRNTPGITGIVGSSGSGAKPFPVPRDEMIPVFKAAGIAVDDVVCTNFEVGEKIKIIDGPFNDYVGQIVKVDVPTSTLTVTVTIFSRPSNIEVKFNEVEKTDE